MKKIMLTIILILGLSLPVIASDTVCGKTYMLTIDHELYLIKFPISIFGPDCSGDAIFIWSDQKKIYKFMTSEVYFIKVTELGDFVLKNNELIFINPDSIRLTEY